MLSVTEYVRIRYLEFSAQEGRCALDRGEKHRLTGFIHQDVPRREFLHGHFPDQITLGAVGRHIPLLRRLSSKLPRRFKIERFAPAFRQPLGDLVSSVHFGPIRDKSVPYLIFVINRV